MPESRSDARRRFLLATALFVALGVILLAGAWRHWAWFGSRDWVCFNGQVQAEITTLEKYGQFPLWNPWRHGGLPGWAQPESMLISPLTPVAFVAGVPAAFKLVLLPLFLVGCWGLWLYAGALGLRGWARSVPALAFFGSSVFPLFLVGGLPNWLMAIVILPWMLLAAHRAHDGDWRFVPVAGLLYALVFFCGSIYHFIFFPGLLLLDAVRAAVTTRSWRPALRLLGVMVVGVCLAAPRLVPVHEIYQQIPRVIPGAARTTEYNRASWPGIARYYLDPRVPDVMGSIKVDAATFEASVGSLIARGYAGPAVVLLALLGALRWRRSWHWVTLALLGLWLARGSGAFVSLWDAVQKVPVIESMRFPQRLLLLTTFALAMLAGFGFDWLESRLPARRRGRLLAGLLALLIVPMAAANAPISQYAFPLPPPAPVEHAPQFRQSILPAIQNGWGGDIYLAVLGNVGNVEGTAEVIAGPTPALPDTHRDYRGEVYLADGHGHVSANLTPNVIDVRAHVDGPDVLVVNQNWFPGWRVEGTVHGTMAPRGGLLSIALPAGDHELRLRYAPTCVVHGALIGGLALLVTLGYLLVRFRRSTSGAPEPRRWGRAENVALAAYLLLTAGLVLALRASAEVVATWQ